MAAMPVNDSPSYQMPNALDGSAEFHTTFGVPVLQSPKIPDSKRCALRLSLLREEVQELSDAIEAGDLTECADALADIQYVLAGTVHEFGLGSRFKPLFDDVHRSNMTKACATKAEADATIAHYLATKGVEAYTERQANGKWNVYRAGDHKTLKSINYSPPSLAPIIAAAGVAVACPRGGLQPSPPGSPPSGCVESKLQSPGGTE